MRLNYYTKIIAELDRVLATLRLFWLQSKEPKEKAKWAWRLDQSLDERMRLMRCRDAYQFADV